MVGVVNPHEYQNLCSMSFRDISAMTSQLAALDNSDNFNYIMALQDICSKIANPNRNYPRDKVRFRKRRKRPLKKKDQEENSGWFSNNWWDIFGLFTTTDTNSEKSDDVNSFSLLDPLGLFASEKSDDSSQVEYYDYDYSDINRRVGLDFSESVPYFESLNDEYYDLKPSSTEQNQRLAFVHYVYPKTSTKSTHFKSFEN